MHCIDGLHNTFCVFKEQEARTKLLRERVRDDSQSTSSAVCYDEPGHVNLFHEEEKGAGVRKFGYLLTSRLGQDMFNYHHCVVQLVSFLAGSIDKCRVRSREERRARKEGKSTWSFEVFRPEYK
jgi:hypothetical protein